MTWNNSNLHFGLTAIRDRPTDIRPRWHESFCTLSAFADREMGLARHLLTDDMNPALVRRRLCRFWGRLSRQILVEQMQKQVLEVLADLADYEYLAAGIWLDGKWHHNGVAMARILWHLQCSDRLVSAALDLHRRVSQRTTNEEEISRIRGTGGFLAILMSASL